jgi:hypothetical protein
VSLRLDDQVPAVGHGGDSFFNLLVESISHFFLLE